MTGANLPEMPAIPANHIPIAQDILYRTIVQPATWSQFSRVWMHTEGPVPHPADGPLIIYLNHTAWWDAYMLFVIYYKALHGRFQNYIMMEEQQLRPFRFFSWCGAFSINRKRPGDPERSIGYISRILRERRDRCLWIFPQGRIVPNDRRPLVVYPGITRIVQQAGGALLWPIGLRYEFRGQQRPEAFIRAGQPHYATAGNEPALLDEINTRLTATVDALRADVLEDRLVDYRVIMEGQPGIDRVFAGALARIRRRADRDK